MAYNWEVVIPDPPSVVSPYVELMSVKARSVVIPGVEDQGYDTQFGPFVFSHPGRKVYPRRLDLRFEETYVKPVIEALKLWQQLVFDEEAGAGVNEDALKANLWVRLLGPDPEGRQAIEGAVHVYDVFPINIANITLGYDSDAQIFVAVTMAYNVWRWESWPF
jgi:hypothetical protein